MMSVVNNIGSLNARRQYGFSEGIYAKSAEKLSSGFKVNRAADDAAGLTISEKMRSLIRGLNQGSDNITDGISLCQVADGALSEIHDMLHRMTELAIKASNGTNTQADRLAVQSEIQELAAEITRIGKSTTFNTMHILDDATNTGDDKITKLVASPSADRGYLSEAIQVNGYWFPSGSVDFSGINADNIDRLEGGGFSFCCSRGCDEIFEFEFTTDGSPTRGENLSGKVHHKYYVDISHCGSGSDVVNAIFNAVQTYPPVNNSAEHSNELLGSVCVSHSNNMVRTADGNGLIVYANRRVATYGNYVLDGYATEEEAKNAYPLPSPSSDYAGIIDCSSLVSIESRDLINKFDIQCSNNKDDYVTITTRRVNAIVLGVDGLNLTTQIGALGSIKKIEKALDKISRQRSEIGANQNRLESSFRNNENKAENTQAAESLIRDTDMAKEMVRMIKSELLMQVGNAMMVHANQSTEGVLSLLRA